MLAEYLVGRDGRVIAVHLTNPGVSWPLFVSVRDWLYDCRFIPSSGPASGPVDVTVVQPFIFRIQ